MAETTAPKKRATRKRTTTTKRARKAPTNSSTPAVHTGVSSQMKFTLSLFAAFVIISGISFVIGILDKGAIDVKGVVNQRAVAEEAKGNTEEGQAIRAIGQQNTTNDLPNDGLIGAGNRATRQQEQEESERILEEIASSTASSTDAQASSTEEVGEGMEDVSLTDTEQSGIVNETQEEKVVQEEESIPIE